MEVIKEKYSHFIFVTNVSMFPVFLNVSREEDVSLMLMVLLLVPSLPPSVCSTE